jgi:hypothetical protein
MQKGDVHVRHAPPRNILVSSYVRVDRIAPQFVFLSLQIESGFALRRRESYSLHLGVFPQMTGELLPPYGHISSKHLKMHSLRPCQQPIENSHSNFGINWHQKVQDTLNLLRASQVNPTIPAYEALNGPYNWNWYPLVPPG